MKKTFLLSICMIIGAGALYAQQTIYIIDNKNVEHFDGSQLKGKYIRDYKITSTGSGRNTVTVHSISTSSSFSVAEPNKQPIGRMELSEPPLLTTKPLGQPTGQMMEIAEPVIGSTISYTNTAPGSGPEEIKLIHDENNSTTVVTRWGDDNAERITYIVDGEEVPEKYVLTIPKGAVRSIETSTPQKGSVVITINTKLGDTKMGDGRIYEYDEELHRIELNEWTREAGNGEGYTIMKIETSMELSELMEKIKNMSETEIDANGRIFRYGQPVTKITINGRSYSVKNGQFELDD